MPGHFTFYTDQILGNKTALFSESESKHMVQVLRYNQGDQIYFTDGKGNRYMGALQKADRKNAAAEIVQTEMVASPQLILALGILKSSDRMELVVEKAVELGLKELILLTTDNSERKKVNTEKLGKTAIAAMKQSHGSYLPEIHVTSVEALIDKFNTKLMVAHCEQGFKALPKILQSDSVVCIGPEGDFSQREIELFKSAKATEFSLGKRILRAETAAIAAVTLANLNA